MNFSETEYLRFITHEPPGRKTPIVAVHNKRSSVKLGEIKWYGAWRQYCFFPSEATIFNTGCLTDIRVVIQQLMDVRHFAVDEQTGEPK
jgi:hypothetical protein